MKREFQAGDRVKIVGTDFGWHGTILQVGHSRSNVQFDGREAHDYWPTNRSLEPIEPVKKKVEPLPLPG
jgi:hypothetical protein